jgi:hypothetical protein
VLIIRGEKLGKKTGFTDFYWMSWLKRYTDGDVDEEDMPEWFEHIFKD